MFIEENMLVKAVYEDGNTYTGNVYRIVIQLCKDDGNRPHALVFISQDKRFISRDGEFGCEALWVDKIKSIELLQPYYTPYHYGSQQKEINFMENNFNVEALLRKIHALCKKRNISVNRMLKSCGLSKSVVDNLKKGFIPRVDKVKAIADYFGVTVDYLLAEEPQEPEEKQTNRD